jgi:hypothetical protein
MQCYTTYAGEGANNIPEGLAIFFCILVSYFVHHEAIVYYTFQELIIWLVLSVRQGYSVPVGISSSFPLRDKLACYTDIGCET